MPHQNSWPPGGGEKHLPFERNHLYALSAPGLLDLQHPCPVPTSSDTLAAVSRRWGMAPGALPAAPWLLFSACSTSSARARWMSVRSVMVIHSFSLKPQETLYVGTVGRAYVPIRQPLTVDLAGYSAIDCAAKAMLTRTPWHLACSVSKHAQSRCCMYYKDIASHALRSIAGAPGRLPNEAAALPSAARHPFPGASHIVTSTLCQLGVHGLFQLPPLLLTCPGTRP